MPYVELLPGGNIGRRKPGWRGEVSAEHYEKRRHRYRLLDAAEIAALKGEDKPAGNAPIPHQTTAVQAEDVVTRGPRYVAKHRGGGRWAVVDEETGEPVTEAMDKAAAEDAADAYNAA